MQLQEKDLTVNMAMTTPVSISYHHKMDKQAVWMCTKTEKLQCLQTMAERFTGSVHMSL
jgi:hypothetical protein